MLQQVVAAQVRKLTVFLTHFEVCRMMLAIISGFLYIANERGGGLLEMTFKKWPQLTLSATPLVLFKKKGPI
jgi:hypothetical protein